MTRRTVARREILRDIRFGLNDRPRIARLALGAYSEVLESMAEDFITPQIITIYPRQSKGRGGNILDSAALRTTNMIVVIDRAIISGFTPPKLQLLNNSQLM
jgi:hypothetical protein